MDKQLAVDNSVSSIRSAIFTLGGILISAGWIQDSDLALWGGIAVNVVTVAWLFLRNRANRKEQVSGIQVGQAIGIKEALPLKPNAAAPAVMSEQEITAKLNSGAITVPATPVKEPTS